ncbi:hypothetical protein ACXZ65_35075 [Streptomyces aculeolatus]
MTDRTAQQESAEIGVGDVYEDCAFHLVLCTHIVDEGGGHSLAGISLIDGSAPRSCDPRHCGPVRIPMEQVMAIKRNWPEYVRRRKAEVGI